MLDFVVHGDYAILRDYVTKTSFGSSADKVGTGSADKVGTDTKKD